MSALIPGVPQHVALYITVLVNEISGYWLSSPQIFTAFLRLAGAEWLSEVTAPPLLKLA